MADEKAANQLSHYPVAPPLPPQPPYDAAPQYSAGPPQQQYGVTPPVAVVTPQYGEAPAYAVTVPNQQQQVPVGNGVWKNSLFGCTKSLPWCIIGCCLPGVLLTRIADYTKNWDQVRPILILLAILSLLSVSSSVIGQNSQSNELDVVQLPLLIISCMGALLSLVLLVIFIFKMCKLRGEVRKRYNIGGSELNDFLTTCCCTVCCCCSLHECQMFYEVAEYEKMQLD